MAAAAAASRGDDEPNLMKPRVAERSVESRTADEEKKIKLGGEKKKIDEKFLEEVERRKETMTKEEKDTIVAFQTVPFRP